MKDPPIYMRDFAVAITVFVVAHDLHLPPVHGWPDVAMFWHIVVLAGHRLDIEYRKFFFGHRGIVEADLVGADLALELLRFPRRVDHNAVVFVVR